MVNGGYAHGQLVIDGYTHGQKWPTMVDMLRCNGCYWWICSCVGEVIGGYAQTQSWSLMDIVMCRVVNGGYAQVQWWSMVDLLMYRAGH